MVGGSEKGRCMNNHFVKIYFKHKEGIEDNMYHGKNNLDGEGGELVRCLEDAKMMSRVDAEYICDWYIARRNGGSGRKIFKVEVASLGGGVKICKEL